MSLEKIKRDRRMMLELIIVVVLIGFFVNLLANTVYTLYSQIKIWLFISIFAIGLLTLYILSVFHAFSLKIEETIPFVFAFNRKEIFVPCFNLWISPLSLASFYLREIIKEKPELIEKLASQNNEFDRKLFTDLTAFLVLEWLCQRFAFWWSYKRPVEYSFRRLEQANEKPSIRVKYSDLRGDFQKNNIFSSLIKESNFHITVPPKTIISMKEGENKWIICLKNRYCEITLRIYLASWSSFWMLQDVPVHFSSDEKRKEFETFDIFIDFEARFSRVWSLDPRMSDYYEWAEGMLERLRNDFDWRVQIPKIQKVLKVLNSKCFVL